MADSKKNAETTDEGIVSNIAGYIVSVKDKTAMDKPVSVVVASDGWGRSWDETIEWGSPRLAELYTYTKRVKCFVDILRKPSSKPSKRLRDELPKGSYQGFCTLWPSTVQFRMPHPTNLTQGEMELLAESKVFVQPYALDFLSPDLRATMVFDGGAWFPNSRLRLWKDNLSLLGVLPPKIEEAVEIAKADSSVPGFLLPKALISGTSLLNDVYRVFHIQGTDQRDGVLTPNDDIKSRRSKIELPPSVVQVGPMDEADRRDDEEKRSYPPPFEPPPMRLNGPIYSRSGIRQCKKSNMWIATLYQNAGEVFLGEFPTETQAFQATRVAGGENVNIEPDVVVARKMDLDAVPISMIVKSFEKSYVPSVHSWSLHQWTVEKSNYENYLYLTELKKKAKSVTSNSTTSSGQEAKKPESQVSVPHEGRLTNKRKRKAPKRLR